MCAYESVKKVLKEFLEKNGFEVSTNQKLKGISGIEHDFDVVACKNNLMLCFDIDYLDEKTLIRVFGKAIDVEYAKCFLLSEHGEAKVDLTIIQHVKRLSVILFKNPDDLVKKLSQHIASTQAQPPLKSRTGASAQTRVNSKQFFLNAS